MSEYIGKRIIPRHDGKWDVNKTYEPLCLVLDENGDSYISRKDVPAGTALTNTNYWSLAARFSEQIKLAGDHMDETVEKMVKENADTVSAVNKTCSDTVAAVNKKAEENLAAVSQKAEDTVNAVNETCDSTVKKVTAQTDNVVADTEKVQADVTARMDAIEKRQDANVTASTDKNADYAAEVVDARTGLGGTAYDSLGGAVRSFSSPYTFRKRMKVSNANYVFSGKGDYTTASVRDIKGSDGAVRAGVYSATIIKDYSLSSIMTKTAISITDFNQYFLGKEMVVQFHSPFSGYMNFSLGSGNSGGSGALDDPKGADPEADGSLYLDSISYNLYVGEGYNELTLDLSEELPQVQILKSLITEKGWSSVILAVIPFQWRSATFVPETGKTYDFYIAICEAGGSIEPEKVFRSVTTAAATTAENALRAVRAQRAMNADEADHAEESANAVYAANAGIRVLGTDNPPYSTHEDQLVSMDKTDGTVSVTVSNKTYLTTGQGFSVRIGKVSVLTGKKLLLKREETEGYVFGTLSINFGAMYGNYSYVSVPGAVTDLGGGLYRIDFDLYRSAAEKKGIAFNDETYCWMMIYNNNAWPVVSLADGETVTNRYRIFREEENAFIYDRETKETLSALKTQLEKATEENETLSGQVDKLTEQLAVLQEKADAYEPGKGNVLYGKKWFATGDSFTSGGSVEDDKYFTDGPYKGKIKTYPLFIGLRNDMDVTNDAISGSIMALDKTYVADKENGNINTRRPFSYQRYLTIPEDVDYITLWFGINDASNTDLGTISDTTNETFYGAWNVVMEWILTNRPWAKVGIIITNGSTEAYRDAEREIARKWGIPYLDMMGDDRVPVMTLGRETDQGLSTKAYQMRRSTFGVGHSATGDSHPCWQAHEWESTFIEDFLRSL